MAPQFVNSYVKTNKNDVTDAEAICDAVQWNHVVGQKMTHNCFSFFCGVWQSNASIPVVDLRLGQPPPFLFKFDRLRP